MALASEILARAHEHQKSFFPDKSDRELVAEFLAIEQEIGLLEMLRSLNSSDRAVSSNKNSILIFSGGKPLEVKSYRDAPEALRALFELENQYPDGDIVLVRADTSDEVRLAFKNYFSDARDFIKLIETGCAKLSRTKRIMDISKSQFKSSARKR